MDIENQSADFRKQVAAVHAADHLPLERQVRVMKTRRRAVHYPNRTFTT